MLHLLDTDLPTAVKPNVVLPSEYHPVFLFVERILVLKAPTAVG